MRCSSWRPQCSCSSWPASSSRAAAASTSAALGLFVFGVLAPRSAAMVHPEPMSLFFTTLALVLAARMIVRRAWTVPSAIALGAALGAAQLVRAFSLWTFGVVVLVLAVVAVARSDERRRALIALLVTVLATGVVAGPWYAYQSHRYTNPVFDRPQVQVPLLQRRPAAFYVNPELRAVFGTPVQDEPQQPLRAAAVHGRVGGLLRRLRLEQRRPPARRLGEARAEGADVARDRADAPARRRLARAPLRGRSRASACDPRPSGCSSGCCRSRESSGCCTSPSAIRPPTATSSRRRTCSPPCRPGRSASATGSTPCSSAGPGCCPSLRPARARGAVGAPPRAVRLASRHPLSPPPLPSPSVTAVLFTCAGQRVDIVTAFGRAGATTIACRSRSAGAGALLRRSHGARAEGRRSRLRAGARGARCRVRREARRAGDRHRPEHRRPGARPARARPPARAADRGVRDDGRQVPRARVLRGARHPEPAHVAAGRRARRRPLSRCS